jgi:CO dehydrogenase nickel-insertion accessory protein CooC1
MIEIIVTGKTGSGKSPAVALIERALKEAGYEVQRAHQDPHHLWARKIDPVQELIDSI